MARWTCPECGRTFGRQRQGHLCVPGTTVEDWFADEPPELLAVHEEIVDHLTQLGDVVVEPVAVGIFYKRGRTFAQLRPRYDHLVLSVLLPRKVDDPRFKRKPQEYGRRVAHWIPLAGPDDVDDDVRGWLTESWLDSPEP